MLRIFAESKTTMNPNQKKNLIYTVVLLSVMGGVYLYRAQWPQAAPVPAYTINGTTFGTVPYTIKYQGEGLADYGGEIRELLEAFNQALSTYIPASEISRFNSGMGLAYSSPYFYPVLAKSKEVVAASDGYFDPTVMPLVKAWGFGPGKGNVLSAPEVDSLLQLVGFDKIRFDSDSVSKVLPGVSLDFSAIAKGYAVDLAAGLLAGKGVADLMVEIGGEVVCRGKNPKGSAWVIGIDNPEYQEKGGEVFSARISLTDMALATSGNYRNFYVKDGKKYAHTIDPKTGWPVEHSLLSASVVAPDCMTADAYATAFMAMGTEKSIRLVESLTGIEAMLVYDDGGTVKTYLSPGMEKFLDVPQNQPVTPGP